MYAIVRTGGKQYKVSKDDVLKVELLNKEVGDKLSLEVLMVSSDGTVKTGADASSAKVTAEVVFNGRGKKLNIYKYKAKKNERKSQGHRQPYSEIKIVEVNA